MKSIKLIGPALLAVLALGSFATSTALAEEGFLKTGGHPALGILLGGQSTIEIEGGGKIVCALLDETTIEFANDKHGKATLHLLKCKAEGIFGAISLGAAVGSEEILVPVLFLVCLDAINSNKVLVSQYGIATEVVGTTHLEIPATGTLIEVKGIALGDFVSSSGGTLFKIEFKGHGGAQEVAIQCKEGELVKSHNLLGSVNHGAFKPTSETILSGLIQFTEVVELMEG